MYIASLFCGLATLVYALWPSDWCILICKIQEDGSVYILRVSHYNNMATELIGFYSATAMYCVM